MSEIKRKIPGEKVRIPDELMSELNREIAATMTRGERSPSRGDLLMAAWRAAKGKVKPIEPEIPKKPRLYMAKLREVYAGLDESDSAVKMIENAIDTALSLIRVTKELADTR